MKVEINYDGMGKVCSDFDCEYWVTELLNNDGWHDVGSGILILAIRARMKREKISSTDVCFYYRGIKVELDDNYNFINPPKGFGDKWYDYLNELSC